MVYKLIRETVWIKEWQTPSGTFIDSKLRWLGLEPSVEGFIAAWRGASGPEKFDLEAAFEFYPYELDEDVERILEVVAAEDPSRAKRMAEKLFRGETELPAEKQKFLNGLGEYFQAASEPMRVIGENKWFAAYANDAGFHVDTRIGSMLEIPTDDELDAHMAASLSLAYRRILKVVKENKWLLEPWAGELPFPGL